MDDFIAYIAGGLLLLGASLAPQKSRDFFKNIFTSQPVSNDLSTGDATQFGNNLTNSGASHTQPETININAFQGSSLLSEVEVFKIAEYIKSKHGFNLDTKMLVATAYIESSFRPKAVRHERRNDGTIWDSSFGLMQTLLGTAKDMYAKGYRAYGVPSADDLMNPVVSMYFGASYMDWLRNGWRGRDDEFYIRAYNGRPGWRNTPNGAKNTAHYYKKYASAYKKFSITVNFG